jgi:Flp pilus assembly protein TadG
MKILSLRRLLNRSRRRDNQLSQRQRCDGVASVELALILPLFLSLIFVMVEASVAFYDKAILTHASREAARLGVLSRTTAMPLGEVENYAISISESRLLSLSGATKSPSALATTGTSVISGSPVLTVTVTYPYEGLLLGPLLSALSRSITLSATTVMHYE